jgi:hypothetical protein
MTKYFVMRECDNIPTWISLCVTTVFSQQGGISVFLNSFAMLIYKAQPAILKVTL